MLKLIIEDDEGRKTVVPFVRDEITIGRQDGNTIRLIERNVSRRHARLVRSNGHLLLEDLASYNGVRLNGAKVSGQTKVQAGDVIRIGDYDLALQEEAATQPATNGGAVVIGPAETLEAEIETTRPRSIPPELPTELDNRPLGAAPEPARAPVERAQLATSIIRVDQMGLPTAGTVETLDPKVAPRLVVLNSEFAGREFACVRTELRIGRTDDNDIVLDHRSMSRTHAKLTRGNNGDWRVVDLQSANGLKVNGESYGQSALRYGDVLELGHVKLKFLAAGEVFKAPVPAPQKDAAPAKKGGRKGLAVGIGAVAVLALAGGGFVLFGGESEPAAPAVAAAAPPPSPASAADEAEAADTVEMPPPEPALPADEIASRVKQARAAIAARDFEKALSLLDEAAAGGASAEVQELIDQASREASAKKSLALAQRALEDGDLEQASTRITEAEGTRSYAKDYERLKGRIDAAVARAEAKRPRPASATTVSASATKPAAAVATPAELAGQHLEDGIQLLKKKQYATARDSLLKCLQVDPQQARCHMYLGSAYAKLRELETAATHYRSFIAMAPDDPLAPKVKELLEQYDKQK